MAYNHEYNDVTPMSISGLSTLLAPQTDLKPDRLKPGSPVDDEVKLEAILSIAELMEKGTRSTPAIQQFLIANYGIRSRDSAVKYRNLAGMLMQRESKPMNREMWRAMEIGRLNWWIERLSARIQTYEAQAPKTRADEDYLKWHDTYAKMLSKLNDFAARLHAITGLNELTINSNEHKSRIVFHFDGSKNTTDKVNVPKSHNTSPSGKPFTEIIEGEATPT